MNCLRLSLIVSVLAASPALAGDFDPVQIQPGPDGVTEFYMPSGNIECFYDAKDGLDCDRAAPTYVRMILHQTGKPQLIKNLDEQPCCSNNNILPYGRSFRAGSIECDSRADGLYCTREDGHGFRLNKEKAEVF